MTNSELILLIDELRTLTKENEWVEFKSGNATTNDKLGQYISAISNAACISNKSLGYLIFGINDSTHEVVGTNFRFKNKKEGNEELELWLRRLLYPSIRFQHFICQYGKLYLEIFQIPAAKSEPTHFKKIPHIRFNSSLTDLRNFPHYVKAIYNSEEDWSANIVEKATIDNLDQTAIDLARQKFKEKKAGTPLYEEIDHWSDASFLDKAKITIGGKITNTAIILLGKAESIHLISPSVAQITWKLDTEEQAYEHFDIPLFVEINKVLARIRNVKYKFFPDNQLLSVEVNKYETKVILEALNNCIAHQDYGQHARIVLTEQINKLIFSNAGGFVEGNAEDYTAGDKTPEKYRNRWLANAMVNLNMIDTMGYGIHRMYIEQRRRFFPLPDYTQSTRDRVVLEIYGHSIDENYSKLLIEKNEDLSLTEVILLDKIQKCQTITDDAARLLKRKLLIEGRKPNFYISAGIAEKTDQKAEYIKNRGFKDQHYKNMVLEYLDKYGSASKQDVDKLILDILPAVLDIHQKENKIRNLLYSMSKRDQTIINQGTNRNPVWKKNS
ncbi:MAG TPA: putative DNA binding domain-containing protein [Bacteroidales bacterium]|nr:putative DNA binding domain-containing protein [Bacteroidales bacterium]